MKYLKSILIVLSLLILSCEKNNSSPIESDNKTIIKTSLNKYGESFSSSIYYGSVIQSKDGEYVMYIIPQTTQIERIIANINGQVITIDIFYQPEH